MTPLLWLEDLVSGLDKTHFTNFLSWSHLQEGKHADSNQPKWQWCLIDVLSQTKKPTEMMMGLCF